MGFTLTQNPIKLNSLNRPMWGLLAVKFEKTMKLNPSLCQILSLFSDLGGSVGLPKSNLIFNLYIQQTSIALNSFHLLNKIYEREKKS